MSQGDNVVFTGGAGEWYQQSERIGDRRIWRDAVEYLETNVYLLLASASEVLCVHAC